MTESEWLAWSDPLALTSYLLPGKITSPRKLRLFAVACCRLGEHLVPDEAIGKALAATERYADGLIQLKTLLRYSRACWEGYKRETIKGNPAGANVARAVRTASSGGNYLHTPREMARALATATVSAEGTVAVQSAIIHALERMSDLLRDIVPNPFRPLPAHDAAWLAANGGLAGRLASSIYDERKFGELPILADALEDAGCTEAALLEHLRGPGPHERGCWALDVVLGKG
jgi:hypothetical protein